MPRVYYFGQYSHCEFSSRAIHNSHNPKRNDGREYDLGSLIDLKRTKNQHDNDHAREVRDTSDNCSNLSAGVGEGSWRGRTGSSFANSSQCWVEITLAFNLRVPGLLQRDTLQNLHHQPGDK